MTDILREMLDGALAKAMSGGDEEKVEMPVGEQISSLRSMAALYGARGRFKVGDLVTVHPNGDSKGKAQPHIVLEVLDKPIDHFSQEGNSGSNQWGLRLDVRVLTWAGEHMTAFWLESWKLIPYNPDNSAN